MSCSYYLTVLILFNSYIIYIFNNHDHKLYSTSFILNFPKYYFVQKNRGINICLILYYYSFDKFNTINLVAI